MPVYGWAAYGCAGVFAAALSYFIFRMPFQVSDNVNNMLQVLETSIWVTLKAQFTAEAFLRPFSWGSIEALMDLSGGHYFLVFRSFHALQFAAFLLLFVRLLRVRTAIDFTACAVALLVLIGSHTFNDFARQHHPIPGFMTLALCTVAALNLSASRGGWWVDLAAALLFTFASLSAETGLLVWVVVVAGRIAGFRGVSNAGIAAVTLLLVTYFVLRFGVLGVGSPGLDERAAGYGFERLSTGELQARFGDNPAWFYVANIVSSILTVPLSEPRAGFWAFTHAIVVGPRVPPWMAINIASSVGMALIIAAHVIRRGSRWLTGWRAGALEHGDRLVLVAAALLVANACISFPYTKDVVMSPAAAGYAAAAYVGLRGVLMVPGRKLITSLALAVLLFGVTSLWAVRVVGLGYGMRQTAATNRNDWVEVFDWLDQQQITLTPRGRAFVEQLQNEMILKPIPHEHFTRQDAGPYFDPY
jgi:hypothetical protein